MHDILVGLQCLASVNDSCNSIVLDYYPQTGHIHCLTNLLTGDPSAASIIVEGKELVYEPTNIHPNIHLFTNEYMGGQQLFNLGNFSGEEVLAYDVLQPLSEGWSTYACQKIHILLPPPQLLNI